MYNSWRLFPLQANDLLQQIEHTDVQMLEQLKSVLQPFYDATLAISGESYATISLVDPLMSKLKQSVGPAADDSTLCASVKEVIADNLNKRYNRQ